jgi:hypothetical protein
VSRDILHAKGRLSIEVLVATAIVQGDMDSILFQGMSNGVGSLGVRCSSSMAGMNSHDFLPVPVLTEVGV